MIRLQFSLKVLFQGVCEFIRFQRVLCTEVEREFVQVLSLAHLDRSCLFAAKLNLDNYLNLEGNQEHSNLIRSDNRLGHSLQLRGH